MSLKKFRVVITEIDSFYSELIGTIESLVEIVDCDSQKEVDKILSLADASFLKKKLTNKYIQNFVERKIQIINL